MARALSLLLLLGVAVYPSNSTFAASSRLLQVSIPQPATNLPGGGWVANDARVVYVQDNPLRHAPSPSGGPYFTNFRPEYFEVRLRTSAAGLEASSPHLLFTGPPGVAVGLGSTLGNWLIYGQDVGWRNPSGPWQMFARNVVTGRSILLDSNTREGMPSLTPPGRSDGRTVVWQSWTMVHGRPTSVIRTYDLVTGQRRLVAQGGSPDTGFYTWVKVSGHYIVFERDDFTSRRSQIILEDLRTLRMKALTPPTATSSEPSISSGVVVWKDAFRSGTGRHVVVDQLASGRRTVLNALDGEAPEVTAGRYVVYRTGYGKIVLRVYDLQTHTNTVLFAPHNGYMTGGVISVGGHIALHDVGHACGSPDYLCPGRLVATRLP